MSCQQPRGWVEPIHFIFGYFDLEGSAVLIGSTLLGSLYTQLDNCVGNMGGARRYDVVVQVVSFFI